MIIKKKKVEDVENLDYNKNILDKIRYFLDNINNLSNIEYYKMLYNFYDIKLENKDYLDYINYKTNNNFTEVITLTTDYIDSILVSEGHGRDFSYWTVKYRLYLKVAVPNKKEDHNKTYTLKETKKLISENKMYPLNYFYKECDDNIKVNIQEKNDIEYLVKEDNGMININDEYFDYIITKLKNSIQPIDILMDIRKVLVSYKLELDYRLFNNHYDEEDYLKEKPDKLNNIINYYNNYISSNNLKDKIQIIPLNSVKIITDYISNLPNLKEEEKFEEITVEQIMGIVAILEYDKNKELCNEIQELIIKVADSELCLTLSYFYWTDYKRLEDIIINSGDLEAIYLLARDNDNANIPRLAEAIIASGNAEYNYKFAVNFEGLDIKRHGNEVIKSMNTWYNYLFAHEIENADIRAHGEVIIKLGTAIENIEFSEIYGADKERHYEAARRKEEQNYNPKTLKRTK